MRKERIYLEFVDTDGYIFRGENGEEIAFAWRIGPNKKSCTWKIKLKPKLEDEFGKEDVSFKTVSAVKDYLHLVARKLERYNW